MLGRLLDLREGEGRVAGVLFLHLFFVTVAAIVLSAAKNGLFLSAYPAEWIPGVIVAGALTTAVLAILFTGLTAGVRRRTVIEWTAGVAAASLVAARAAFLADPRTSFGIYLLLSVIVALVVALAWGSVGDHLTGRQSRRLMPLLVAGTSVAGIAAGFGLAPAAAAFGTPNLLAGAAAALLMAAGALRFAPRPTAPRASATGGFVARVRKGVGVIAGHRLLTLLAGAIILSAATATLVDYQFKAVLQEAYDRDAITSLFGVLAGAVGVGTLLVQALASRLLFRRLGIVSGGYVQAVALGVTGLWVAVTGWLAALAALRFVDETARFTLQKTVEQVSVAPYTPEVRSSALTVLGGVLKPVATAATGLALVLLAPLIGVRGLALLTAAAAATLFALFRRHPPLYRAALEDALTRHAFQLDGDDGEGALTVVDRGALEVLDRALASRDPALLIFAVSILRKAPRAEAVPRLEPLLGNAIPEVRAEAAVALVEASGPQDRPELERVRDLLRVDNSPDVIQAVLDVADQLGTSAFTLISVHLEHPEESVRRRALVALARYENRFGGDRATRLVEQLLKSEQTEDRLAGLDAVAVLGFDRLAEPAYQAARDARTRSAAVSALAGLGPAGDPWIVRLLEDADLGDDELGLMAAQLAESGCRTGLERLLGLGRERGAAAAILGPLQRARRNGRLQPVSHAVIRSVLEPVLGDGARYGLVAHGLRHGARDAYTEVLYDEVETRHRQAGDAALAGLSLAYDPVRIDRVAPHLRAGDPIQRSNALELLEELLAPEDRLVVVPFFEGYESAERLEETARALGVPDSLARHEPLEALRSSPDPWLRTCAEYVSDRIRVAAVSVATSPWKPETVETPTMLPIMEIVFFLKSSPLFRRLSGEELARLARVTETLHLEEDQVLFRQGDPGDAFYMVVSGTMAIEVGSKQVAILGPREGFGEMALLDGEPRSATVRALESATLLRIDQPSFDALVDRSPALARAIFKSLSGRLRATLRQVEA